MSTPLWVSLVVAALGLVSTVVGIVVTQIMANRRERASWQRDTDREEQRWRREDQTRTFEHRHVAYVEFYEALRAMMLRVYDHGMGLSDEGDELPEGWQNDAAEAVRRLEVYASPDVSTRAILPMTRRGAGVKPPATVKMTKRSTTTKPLPTLRKSNC